MGLREFEVKSNGNDRYVSNTLKGMGSADFSSLYSPHENLVLE